jgi:RNA polymerase sigma-70 factor (ECF subfamily)
MPPDRRQEFLDLLAAVERDLYWTAVAMSRTDADALDLVQETAYRAWRRFDTYTPHTNFRAWVFTILRHVHIDQARRKKFEPVSLDALSTPPEPPDSNPALPEPAIEDALPDALWRALQSLPPAAQLLLLFSDVQGLSYREIAEIMRCPIGTVMSGLHAARRKLREAYLRETSPERRP